MSKKTVRRFFPMRKMIGQRRTRTRGNSIYGNDYEGQQSPWLKGFWLQNGHLSNGELSSLTHWEEIYWHAPWMLILSQQKRIEKLQILMEFLVETNNYKTQFLHKIEFIIWLRLYTECCHHPELFHFRVAESMSWSRFSLSFWNQSQMRPAFKSSIAAPSCSAITLNRFKDETCAGRHLPQLNHCIHTSLRNICLKITILDWKFKKRNLLSSVTSIHDCDCCWNMISREFKTSTRKKGGCNGREIRSNYSEAAEKSLVHVQVWHFNKPSFLRC